MPLYRHRAPLAWREWYRVDSSSGVDSAVTVLELDGVTPVANAFGGSGSTVGPRTEQGTCDFVSTTQTLYLKHLDYKGALLGDPVVTSTGRDLTAATDAPPGGSLPLVFIQPAQVTRGQVGPNPAMRRLSQKPRTVMAAPPTITHGANGGSPTITSAVTMLMSDPRVRWINARTNSVVAGGDTYYQGGTSGTGQGANFALQRTTWEIDTDAPDVEFRFYNDYGGMWVIDGEPIATSYGVNGKSGNVKSWTKLAFGSRQWRTIRFEGYANGVIAMAVGPTDSIAAPARLNAASWGVLGDSFGQRASSENVYDLYPRVGRLLGFDTVYDSSVGGTGFLNNNSGNYTTFRERLALDVLPQAPTAFGVFGGLNDQSRQSKAALQAEATALFAAIRAYSAVAPIICAAPFTPNLTNASNGNYVDVRDGVLAALQATAGPWVFLDALTGSWYARSAGGASTSSVRALPWITGNGRVGALAGTGNADVITDTDATHPTTYGVEWYARKIASEASAALASIGC
jgi:hypothetical protein